jgi:tetratricopeptide (TPR) repeat protein
MIRKHTLLCLTVCLLFACGCGYHSGQSAVQEGLAAFKGNNFSEAITHFTRATKRITDSPELYYNLGLAHLRQGNMEPAQAAFAAALELAPGHGEALACIGQIAYLQNNMPKAKDCLERALAAVTTDESKARVLTALALTESSRERHDIARLHLLRALKSARRYAPAYYNLASLYRDKFNLREEALDNFEIFVRIVDKKDEHYEKAINNVKRLRMNLERTQAEEAENVRRDPAAAAKLLQEGVRQQIAKQYPKAVKAYRDALAADPYTFSAAFGLAMVYKAQGQRAEAVEAFRRAAEISPNHQDSYFQAAELALQLKHTAEAVKILDRAIARSPYNPANAELMARIRYTESRLPEARAYGEYYLSLMPAGDRNRAPYEKWVHSLPAQ